MGRKLLLNSLSGTVLYIVNVAVTFIMCPVIIAALGNRDYGLWELVMSVIGYMGLLDLGIGGSLVRFVSVADGRNDKEDLQRTISTAFVFFSVVGLLAVLIFFYLVYHPELIAGSESKNISGLRIVFIMLGINAGMLFPLQVFIATLMGVQRHFLINNVRIVLLVLRSLLIYYTFKNINNNGLIVLATIEPIFTSIQFVLFFGVVIYDNSIPNIKLSSVTFSKAKEMISFGAKSAVMLIASRLQNQSVPLIIGNVIGLGSIVYFVIPNRLVDYAKGMSIALGFPLMPYFGAAIGSGHQDALVKSWLNTTIAIQIVSFAMPVVLFFYGETFLKLWLGQEYAVAGHVILYLLIAGLVADALASNAFRILTAQGKHGRCALVWLVLSILSIPIGVWGAQKFGIVGVTVGTIVVTVVANVITLTMACNIMNVSIIIYIKKTLLRTALPLLLLVALLWWLSVTYPPASYHDILIHLMVSGCIYVLAIWQFTLNQDVRDRLLSGISKLAASRI